MHAWERSRTCALFVSMKKKALLAVLAHPDDESFGIGGTVARYVAEGVDVHVVIATDGVAGSVAQGYEEALERLAEQRAAELEAATRVLGCSLHTLDYRDSGYIGDPANHHPDAFVNADEVEVIGRVVGLIRQIRPLVVITHDETGGYFHPDHILCWKITTAAFRAAGDPSQYPEMGPGPYQPRGLYYSVIPRRRIAYFVLFMRLRGQDPNKGGRDKNVDFTRIGVSPKEINAYVDYGQYWEVKRAAKAKHVSQGGDTGLRPMLPVWIEKKFLAKEAYVRAYPPAPHGLREDDLFSSLT